jgi:hypothetical protein
VEDDLYRAALHVLSQNLVHGVGLAMRSHPLPGPRIDQIPADCDNSRAWRWPCVIDEMF